MLIISITDFRDKSYFIMIQVSVNQDDIVNLNVYAPNNRASKHIEQNLGTL